MLLEALDTLREVTGDRSDGPRSSSGPEWTVPGLAPWAHPIKGHTCSPLQYPRTEVGGGGACSVWSCSPRPAVGLRPVEGPTWLNADLSRGEGRGLSQQVRLWAGWEPLWAALLRTQDGLPGVIRG